MISILRELSKFAKFRLVRSKKELELFQNTFKIREEEEKVDLFQQNLDSIQNSSSKQKYQFLSWNNPIREYTCLCTQRFLKYYKWILKSSPATLDIVDFFVDVDDIKAERKDILNWNKERVVVAETKKNIKDANLAIEQLEFITKLRNNPHEVVLLVIPSFGSARHKVFHPLLDEV